MRCKASRTDQAGFAGLIRLCRVVTKKATRGIATPKPDLDLIAVRLKAAEAHARGQTP
jgi:hypothetical protein